MKVVASLKLEPGGITVGSNGALFLVEERDNLARIKKGCIIAPGSWHEVIIETEDDVQVQPG